MPPEYAQATSHRFDLTSASADQVTCFFDPEPVAPRRPPACDFATFCRIVPGDDDVTRHILIEDPFAYHVLLSESIPVPPMKRDLLIRSDHPCYLTLNVETVSDYCDLRNQASMHANESGRPVKGTSFCGIESETETALQTYSRMKQNFYSSESIVEVLGGDLSTMSSVGPSDDDAVLPAPSKLTSLQMMQEDFTVAPFRSVDASLPEHVSGPADIPEELQEHISFAEIQRLAYRAGVPLLHHSSYEEIQYCLFSFLTTTISQVTQKLSCIGEEEESVDNPKSNTVKSRHVSAALASWELPFTSGESGRHAPMSVYGLAARPCGTSGTEKRRKF
jgi:hypothetical protein